MMAVQAVPIAAFFLKRTAADPVLNAVAWAVTVAALVWSAVGIFAFTTAVGTPWQIAWLAPVAIDLSVFGAERALMQAAPVMAALDAAAEASPAEETDPEPVATTPLLLPTPPPVAAPTPPPAPVIETPATPAPTPVRSVARPTPPPTSAPTSRAEAVVTTGKVSTPVETVGQVLDRLDAGMSHTVIGRELGLDPRTVKKVRELDAGAEPPRLALASVQ